MKGVLQMMAAAVAVLIVFAIGAAVWSAHEADGVVIEAFSVPPDLAGKGLSGQVIATRLQDRLAALQAATFSLRAPSSYANNWGDDIKVQIPDTGVSIGELNRYLRNWLGHETHISGEIWHTPDGIAVTARAGSDSSPVIDGREAEFDKLIESAAEAIYRRTQPYRYGVYLVQAGRLDEAKAVFARWRVRERRPSVPGRISGSPPSSKRAATRGRSCRNTRTPPGRRPIFRLPGATPRHRSKSRP